jgi:hypothetical protein
MVLAFYHLPIHSPPIPQPVEIEELVSPNHSALTSFYVARIATTEKHEVALW